MAANSGSVIALKFFGILLEVRSETKAPPLSAVFSTLAPHPGSFQLQLPPRCNHRRPIEGPEGRIVENQSYRLSERENDCRVRATDAAYEARCARKPEV